MHHKEDKQAMQLFNQSSSCSSPRDFICLFHSVKNISISVPLVSVVSGNIRVGPTGKQADEPLVLRTWAACAVLFVPSANQCLIWNNSVPLTPPGETSAESPFFSCAETCARIQNYSLLCCLLVWVGCRGRTRVGALDCLWSYWQHVWIALTAVCAGVIVTRWSCLVPCKVFCYFLVTTSFS